MIVYENCSRNHYSNHLVLFLLQLNVESIMPSFFFLEHLSFSREAILKWICVVCLAFTRISVFCFDLLVN